MVEDLDHYSEAILITQALDMPDAISFALICTNKYKEVIPALDDIITKKIISDPEAFKPVNWYTKYCKYLENDNVDIHYCLSVIKEIHLENRSYNFIDLIQIVSFFKNGHHRLKTILEVAIDCLLEYKELITPFTLSMSVGSIIVKSTKVKLSTEYIEKILILYLYVKDKGPIGKRAQDRFKILVQKNNSVDKLNNMIMVMDLLS